jgi:hypothetical protein
MPYTNFFPVLGKSWPQDLSISHDFLDQDSQVWLKKTLVEDVIYANNGVPYQQSNE